MTRTVGYTVEHFVEDLYRVLDTQGETLEAVLAIGPFLQRLAQEGGDLSEYGEPRMGNSGLPGRLLYRDPSNRFLLALTHFPPHGVTPVHSHEAWGALCLVRGSERYTSWRRLDDGSQPGKAHLAVVQDHHMEPGDLAYWFHDPYNVHRQWPGAAGCTEIVLLGGTGRRLQHFDLERGTWEEATSMGR